MMAIATNYNSQNAAFACVTGEDQEKDSRTLSNNISVLVYLTG